MPAPVTAATGAVVRTPRSSDGTHIYAEAVGNPRNPHVVFVHEATLCASVFDELFEDSRLTDHLFMVSVAEIYLSELPDGAIRSLRPITSAGAIRPPLSRQKRDGQGCAGPVVQSVRSRLCGGYGRVWPAKAHSGRMVRCAHPRMTYVVVESV